jgi:hypothetical protein
LSGRSRRCCDHRLAGTFCTRARALSDRHLSRRHLSRRHLSWNLHCATAGDQDQACSRAWAATVDCSSGSPTTCTVPKKPL